MAGGVAGGLSGCAHLPEPTSTPPAPNQYWKPPARAVVPDSIPRVAIPPDMAERVRQLTLSDVVDLALLNNPQTRASYAQARAASAAVGSTIGRYLPQVSGSIPIERQHASSDVAANNGSGGQTTGREPGTHTYILPSLTASWTLFDFGEAGSISEARETAYAAAFSHNATVQNVILAVQQAFYDYNAAKAIRDAELATVSEDSANLEAAKARHDAGVATISDVLQAQTALSQARLNLETAQGSVLTTRGSLAIAIGVPATVPYDVQAIPPDVPISGIAESVDSLVERAVRSRPDLAASRAQARAAAANVSAVRGEGLPSLTLSSSANRTYLSNFNNYQGSSYSAQIGISIPIFRGFQTVYNVRQAQELAKASAANAEFQRDNVVYQVFTSYYNLRTATAQVRSSADLLQSAQASYDVARGKYQQGVGSILDLLTAESALASARSQQVQARWTWYSTLAQLSHDVGAIGIHGEAMIPLAPDSVGASLATPPVMPSEPSTAPPSAPPTPTPAPPSPPQLAPTSSSATSAPRSSSLSSSSAR